MCNSTESHGLERSYTNEVAQRTRLTTGPLTMETLAVGPVHKTGRKDQGFVLPRQPIFALRPRPYRRRCGFARRGDVHIACQVVGFSPAAVPYIDAPQREASCGRINRECP